MSTWIPNLENQLFTVILFSSRYLFPAKIICPTCKQAIQIVMQIRAVLLHTQQEPSLYFCLILCCWAKNTSGPNSTVRIYIEPMGRDHSHRDCGQTAVPITHHFSQLLVLIIYHWLMPIESIKTNCLNLYCQICNHHGNVQSDIMLLVKEHNKNLCFNRKKCFY